jgi:hypothetical protein
MNERLRILKLIESGQIGVQEGVRRLETLDQGGRSVAAGETPAATQGRTAEFPETVRSGFVQVVWQIVFGAGAAVIAGGGLLLARAYTREGLPGLTSGWVLFTLGLVVLGLGWWLRRARWFTLRVREPKGRALTIALPLPLGFVIWLLQLARFFVPQIQELEVDHMLLALRDELQADRPLVINVDEGADGDQIEVYFG